MKKRALLSLFLGFSAINAIGTRSCSSQLPHLLLFVDINKTIIAEDKAKAMGPEETVAAMLSDTPEYSYTWGNDGKKMTYYAWLNKEFPGADATTKKKREAYQAKFITAAQESNHPMLKKINNQFESLVNTLKVREPRKVLASFSNLIDYLRKNNYSFTIVLRTFGQDLGWVSEELAQDGLNDFIRGFFQKGVLHLHNKVISVPAHMITAFETGKNYAIQDNYDFWKEHNFTEKGGKPFPVNLSDKHTLSIFYDDNAADPVKPILHIKSIGKQTNLHELTKLGRVVPVDTIKAIADPNYFINTIEYALEKWREAFCPQEIVESEAVSVEL